MADIDVKPKTKEWLEDLRPEEVDSLKELVKLTGEIGIAKLREGARIADQVSTVGRFTRWAIIGLFGLFGASVTFAEQISKAFSLLKGVGK